MQERRAGSRAGLAVDAAAFSEVPPEGRFSGRGIVVAGGGARVFTNAYVLLNVLRRTLACRLPIELWHFGAEEISPAMADLLAELDVACVNAYPLIAERKASIRDGWQLKPFAMMWSRFAEVLLLDADQVPVTDPSRAFEWPAYQSKRAVFWPDIVDIKRDNPVWAAVGLPAEATVSFESGQVLVDKRVHWRALSMVSALNERAEELYQLVYGDKDSFLLGWRLAGAGYALVPHRPFIDPHMLVQRDFDGSPLFQHRTNAKWMYSGKLLSIPGFVHEADCQAALDELRGKWAGRVFSPPPGSAAVRAAQEELAARTIVLEVPGEDATHVELRRHGEIAAGRSFDLQNWHLEEAHDASQSPALIFRDGARITYRLSFVAPGRWAGTRFRLPQTDVSASLFVAAEGGASSGPSAGLVAAMIRAAGFPWTDPADDAHLAYALVLVDRVEGSVAQRLTLLADRLGVADDEAKRLRHLARLVEQANASPRRPVAYNANVLDGGYRWAQDVVE